jgi:hypothetical protein
MNKLSTKIRYAVLVFYEDIVRWLELLRDTEVELRDTEVELRDTEVD